MTTLRATEARTVAKMQQDGWELVSRTDEPLLRSKLNFRRVAPKQPKWVWASIAAVALGLAAVVGFNALFGGDEEASFEAAPTRSDTAVAVEPSTEPEAQPIPEPEATPERAALTSENNPELAALLASPETNGAEIEAFAAEYAGQLISFDASIGAMNTHGGYATRYDLLINPGDYSTTEAIGPNFQFRDVNIVHDLHLEGDNIPDTIGVGQNIHVTARVLEFNPTQELFFLEPVSTQIR